jgi:hypothetical protein
MYYGCIALASLSHMKEPKIICEDLFSQVHKYEAYNMIKHEELG